MAIPFFEPNETAVTTTTQNHGDQVDGHGGTPQAATNFSVGNSLPSSSNSNLPSDNEQITAWKILAIAMCKALKDYYEQSPSPQAAFVSGSVGSSIVQVLPNGDVHPLWK